MDLIRATPLTFGTLVWPLRPPSLSMVLVIKATFELVHRGLARLADEQAWPHGAVPFDDDPDRSPRLDNDFALVKPSGECFLAGTCHPPDAPATVSAIAFGVGPIEKVIGVFGDRHWKSGMLGKKTSEPRPFESMELSWERAFGGPGYAKNPYGRGIEPVVGEGGEKLHPLPNLEQARPIAGPGDRPEPAVASPMSPTFASRLALAGTYDPSWARERFPSLAVDFDPAFYLASPPDQRLRGRFWVGNEEIRLRHLTKGRPYLTSVLPGLRARAFVERVPEAGGRFEEIPLVLDTITVDSDAGRAYCVWRGHTPLGPSGAGTLARLFLMHEAFDTHRSVPACRDRMEATLRARAIEASGFVARRPEEDEDQPTLALDAARTAFEHDPAMRALLERVAAAPPDATVADIPLAAPPEEIQAPEAPALRPAEQLLEEIFGQLSAKGFDVMSLVDKAKAPAEPAGPPSAVEVRGAFEQAGVEMPPEVEEIMAKVEDARAAAASPEAAAPQGDDELELTPRERFLLAYAEGRPVVGDFTDVDLHGEELSGLVARDAILAGADFRHCSLEGADLSGANLTRAKLDDASLRGARLERADLTAATARRADFVEADLAEAVLDHAVLEGATLSKARLTKIEARRANLSGATLEGAHGDEADFSNARLVGLKARGASFVDARFTAARVEDADLSECDLTKLRASYGARFDRSNLRLSKLDGARFRDAFLLETNLSFASLERANLSGAKMNGAILAGAVLSRAKLIGADLSRAQILESDLMQASLLGANLDATDLRGSNLFGAELFRASGHGTRLELTSLRGTKWEGRE